MSKRNEYKIKLKDTTNLETIINDLEQTTIVVKVSEPIRGNPTRTITAEDSPTVGASFAEPNKGPNNYIFFDTIKQVLKPHTDKIQKIKHTLQDDTGCYSKITTYKTQNGDFIQTSQEKHDHY